LDFANKLIQEESTNRNAWHEKATAQFFLRDYASAQDSYDQLLSFNPNDHYALVGKGLCYCDTNEYQAALKCFRRAAELEPEDAIAWQQIGRAYAGLGDHGAAADALGRAISIDGQFVEAWHWLAQELQALGRYEEALQCFDVALHYDPENADAWNDRGTLFLAEVNRFASGGESADRYRIVLLREAMRCFDNAISLRPNHPNALQNAEQIEDFNNLRALESLETPVGLGIFVTLSATVSNRRLSINLEDGVAKVPTTNGWIAVRAWLPPGSFDNKLTARNPETFAEDSDEHRSS
jgi:tetratricopeptide (TPR) repeat protein